MICTCRVSKDHEDAAFEYCYEKEREREKAGETLSQAASSAEYGP